MRACGFGFLVLAVGALGACTSQGITEKSTNHQWCLVRVEVDRASLGNAGSLPVFSNPSSGTFGLEPRISGFMRTAEQEKVLVQINLEEPVVGYTGKTEVIEYPLVRLFGVRSSDGSRIELHDENSMSVPLGVATVLHVQRLGRNQLRLQAATRDKLLPYIYIMDDTPARPTYVSVPAAR